MPKATKHNLPPVEMPKEENVKLPYGGMPHQPDNLIFSFACFDRRHKLFNLGGTEPDDKTVGGPWFIELLDCLKCVSKEKIYNLKSSIHDLHPVDWKNANASPPIDSAQCEYWQFRINKSKGRVIGILIDDIFYIVWLDPHHNLSDSAGYPKATYYAPGRSMYELQEEKIEKLEAELGEARKDLEAAISLIEECEK